jgi:Iap family predicted aminopeptidase
MKPISIRGAVLVGVALLAWAGAFTHERMSADLGAFLSQGPRVAGTPAGRAAGDYLAAELKKVGYSVEFLPFTYTRTRDQGSQLRVGDKVLQVYALSGSPAGRLEAVLVAVPGVGRAEDYAGLKVQGAIAVVERGTLPFLEKARQAANAGAVGIVVVNNAPGNVRGTFGGGGPIPGVTVSQEEGRALLAQSGTKAVLDVRIVIEEVQARDVIAKRGGGNPQALVGAHYDSVPGAPGANDNASGSVTVLELARDLAKSPISGRTWFVWFDGEEDGLWGSRKFVEAYPELVRGLRAMLNLDMVGINVLGRLGLGGDDNLYRLAGQSAELVQVSLQSLGRTEGGSDHVPFAQAGVPVLFFHRGLDANYHQPGDRIADIELMIQAGRVARGVLERVVQ